MILWYFSYLLLALIPCHGRYPLRRYTITYPIASRSSLLLCSIPKWALMLAYRLGIPVLLPEPIVDDVDDIRFATKTDEVVVRFDIPMDVAFGMHELDSLDHLVGDHHDGFE
jgi:hypothetical protein